MEDLAKSLFWWPLETVVGVIQTLSVRAEQLKQQIFELTGISDLRRGIGQERESAQAQRLKASYGQIRMTPRSQPMALFVRDTLRIKAEIMAELFDPANLQRIGEVAITPQMLELMREEGLRNTSIQIATDSTVRPDELAEKEDATEYMSAVTGYLQAMLPMALQAPMVAPLVMGILKHVTRQFKGGRALEDTIEQMAGQIEQQAAMQVQMQQQAMQQQAMMQQAAANGGMQPGGM